MHLPETQKPFLHYLARYMFLDLQGKYRQEHFYFTCNWCFFKAAAIWQEKRSLLMATLRD